VRYRRDNDINHQQYTSTTGGRSKADGAKEAWQRAEPFPIAADPSKIKVAVWLASQCKAQLEAALKYAEYGIPVLPCNWKYNDKGVLSKYPMVRKPGVYLATTDPITVRQWWTQWPDRAATKGYWDEARRKVFFFGRLVGGGAYDKDKAWEVLEQAARECGAPEDYPGEVKRAFFNGVNEPTSPFVETKPLDDFCAYLPQHQYIYIPTRELWPASSVNARIPSVDKDQKANTWLDKHRCVEQMTWAPGEEMLIHGRLISEGGWIQKPDVTCFNLYRPPTIEPGDASKAGPWLDHVHKVFGDDAEHIIKWCAQRVQHPEIKINHALLLGSEKQGVGKDAMLEPVKRAVGPWNFGEVGPQQLLGRFNGFLKRTILRVSEVRDLGDINRYQFYEHTKAITAAPPDALRVDEKHLQEHSVLNCVGLILTTNYKTSGIYLPAEDRRHYVAWSHVTPEDFPDGYWNSLWGWYDTGGDRHVAAYLAGLDLSGWDPKVPPPKTEAFWDIVDANRAPEDSQLADILDEMGNPRAVTLRELPRGMLK
jgi:hypothetical protein